MFIEAFDMEMLKYLLPKWRPPRLLQRGALNFAYSRAHPAPHDPVSPVHSDLRRTQKPIPHLPLCKVSSSTHTPDHRHKSSRQFSKPALLSTTAAETLPKFLPPGTHTPQESNPLTLQRGARVALLVPRGRRIISQSAAVVPLYKAGWPLAAFKSVWAVLQSSRHWLRVIVCAIGCTILTNSWALSLLFHPPPSSDFRLQAYCAI